jgi:hypothetical protein
MQANDPKLARDAASVHKTVNCKLATIRQHLGMMLPCRGSTTEGQHLPGCADVMEIEP